MRREVLIELVERLEPEDVLDLLGEVTAGVSRRSASHLLVFEAISQMILAGQQRGHLYELLAEVYRLALDRGLEEVSQILMIAKPQRGPVPEKEAPGDLEMSQLTLGERKFLARGRDRYRLERLLLDPNPAVLRNLLRNPNLVEQDVVRLASRRPVRAEVLREVHESRWGRRYRVRLALVYNPYTPTEVSIKLLAFLLHRDLRSVAADGGLHELVRRQARRLVALRKREDD